MTYENSMVSQALQVCRGDSGTTLVRLWYDSGTTLDSKLKKFLQYRVGLVLG
jgi:hypothetical protein